MTQEEKLDEVLEAMQKDGNVDRDTIHTVLLGSIADSLAIIADCITKEEHS